VTVDVESLHHESAGGPGQALENLVALDKLLPARCVDKTLVLCLLSSEALEVNEPAWARIRWSGEMVMRVSRGVYNEIKADEKLVGMLDAVLSEAPL